MYDVRRSRTMGRVYVLRVATLLAEVHATIERATALIGAAETTGPFLHLTISPVLYLALHLLIPRAAQHFCVDLSAIATTLDLHLAGATKTLVAGTRAGMLSTRQQIPTDLAAAPSIFIVGVLATFGGRIPTAEAVLGRTHGSTRCTRPGMASRVTRMRTAFPGTRTGLPARMRRKTRKWARIDFLFTPAGIGRGKHFLRKITAGTAPGSRRTRLSISPATRTILRRGSLVLGPLLDATQMENGPAQITRPDARPLAQLRSADRTFVEVVRNIFVDPRGDVRGD